VPSTLPYYCTSICMRSWWNWRARSVDFKKKTKGPGQASKGLASQGSGPQSDLKINEIELNWTGGVTHRVMIEFKVPGSEVDLFWHLIKNAAEADSYRVGKARSGRRQRVLQQMLRAQQSTRIIKMTKRFWLPNSRSSRRRESSRFSLHWIICTLSHTLSLFLKFLSLSSFSLTHSLSRVLSLPPSVSFFLIPLD